MNCNALDSLIFNQINYQYSELYSVAIRKKGANAPSVYA